MFEQTAGLTPATAIDAQSVGEQYEYLDQHFSDYSMTSQQLDRIDGVLYDVMNLRNLWNKKEIKVYFKTHQLF